MYWECGFKLHKKPVMRYLHTVLTATAAVNTGKGTEHISLHFDRYRMKQTQAKKKITLLYIYIYIYIYHIMILKIAVIHWKKLFAM